MPPGAVCGLSHYKLNHFKRNDRKHENNRKEYHRSIGQGLAALCFDFAENHIGCQVKENSGEGEVNILHIRYLYLYIRCVDVKPEYVDQYPGDRYIKPQR